VGFSLIKIFFGLFPIFLFDFMPKEHREGYQVGVFKNGRLKKIMKLHEGSQYLREKTKKIKSDKPKRECSPAQLAALAKGRAIRDSGRAQSSGGKRDDSHRGSAPRPSVKNAHRAKESKVAPSGRKKSEKARVRKEKEMETGKHRKNEMQYNSDSDMSEGRRGANSDSDTD
jgi:hypothetical protein